MARILLVDDEGSVLRSLDVLLRTEGHEVVSVNDGIEALKRLEDKAFDLLITDLRMAPIDGIEVLKRAREKSPSMPLIVISAYTSDQVVQRCMALGCRAYIKKPFRIQEVIDAVRQAVGAP